MKNVLSDCCATLCISPGQVTRFRLVQSLCLSSSPRITKRPWPMLDSVGEVQTFSPQWKDYGLGLGAGSYRQSSLALFLWDGHRNYHGPTSANSLLAMLFLSLAERGEGALHHDVCSDPVTLSKRISMRWCSICWTTRATRSKLQLIVRNLLACVRLCGKIWTRARTTTLSNTMRLCHLSLGRRRVQCMWIVLSGQSHAGLCFRSLN